MIPSILGGPLLRACLDSLSLQTEPHFRVLVIDNSGAGIIQSELSDYLASKSFPVPIRIHRSERNLGFAAAVNLAWSLLEPSHLATLNDDAEAAPGWLAALRRELEAVPDVGMCASRILLYGSSTLDSAGMLIARDGSSKQRGQGRPASAFDAPCDVLFPSACAALYRRETLEDVGLFDSDFFLYCEDTDLGLRARWNGWECRYVPDAIVQHHYSQSAGEASPLKLFQVERNRLWVLGKNFPLRMLWIAPFSAIARYVWHLFYFLAGRGASGRFRSTGSSPFVLVAIVIRAHWAFLRSALTLLRKRRLIRKSALISSKQFAALLRRHSISSREIARL